MKKLFAVLIGLFLLFSLSSCNKDSNPVSENNGTVNQEWVSVFQDTTTRNFINYSGNYEVSPYYFKCSKIKLQYQYKLSTTNYLLHSSFKIYKDSIYYYLNYFRSTLDYKTVDTIINYGNLNDTCIISYNYTLADILTFKNLKIYKQ